MSLQPQAFYNVPEETARVARAIFPKGNIYMQCADTFGALFQDQEFGARFAHDCQPAESPAGLVLVLILLGVYLTRVRVVHQAAVAQGGTVLRLLADFPYKRQIATLALDVCLIVLAYYVAYVIRFEDTLPDYRAQMLGSMPIVLLAQLVVLSGFGLYRGIWQYTSISDLIRIGKAATVGTTAAILVLVYVTRFVGFSRTVFVLDWLLLIVLLAGSRVSFRFFAEVFRPAPDSFQRVLIYGAGDGGELIVREILNNPALKRVPVGFIDDDRQKHKTRIHGLPVFGDCEQIETLVREHEVSEVVISSPKVQGPGAAHATGVCRRLGIPVRRASLRFE